MAIYDKASLVLIPSGTKTSKVYSQKPTNGDGDFTFSRSTAATRVNASGNIEKETQNLLLQSNGFSTSPFTTSNTSVTGGQAGYDGTNNAWSLTSNGTNGFENLHQIISFSGVYTISVYAKQGSNDYLTIRTLGDDLRVQFKLDDGTHSTTFGSPIDTFMEDAGGGWYRCGFTANFSSATYVLFYPQIIGITTAGSIYIQDAQLEQGLVARDVITTTTTAIYGGITDNVPRLDYTDSSCPALLLEPQRTNAVPYSEYFNTGWSKVGCSVTSNAATSPEGLQNATKLVEDTSTGLHMLSYADLYVVGAGDDNYLTLYAKEGERRYLAISSRGNFSNNDNTLIFDTRDGVWANNNSFQNTGQDPFDVGNGWWRIQILNDSSSAAYDGFGIGIAEAGDNWDDASYTGDGTSGIYIWGAQAEIGSYATSYIPTYGSGAVTRNGEVCTDAGNSSTFNSTEGVLYAEIKALDNTGGLRLMQLSDGSNNNRVSLYYDGSSAAIYSNIVVNNNANPLSHSITITDYIKVAVTWKENYFSLWVNGNEVSNDTSGATFTEDTLDDFSLSLNGVYPFIGNIKHIMTFNSVLSNEELAALTTI